MSKINNKVEQLIKAIDKDDINEVEKLIESGVDINQKGRCGSPALHVAAYLGRINIIKVLLAKNANKDILNELDRTPLHKAAQNNQISTIEFLLKNGFADMLNAGDNLGRTALELATREGHIDSVKLLLEYKPAIRERGLSPLNTALSDGFDDIAKLLIGYGYDLSKQDVSYKSPLYITLEKNNYDMARYLLERGANPNIGYVDDSLLIICACGETRNIKFAKLLIEFKADLNRTSDPYGFSALHIASANNDAELIELLVDNKASLEIKDLFQGTPIASASQTGALSAIKYLHQQGAKIDDNESLCSPLLVASLNGYNNIIQYLYDNGAKVNYTNIEGNSALHCAAYGGHPGTIELLLKLGNDKINSINTKGETPLQEAFNSYNSSCVKKLIEKGADIPTDFLDDLYYIKQNAAESLYWAFDEIVEGNIANQPKLQSIAKILKNSHCNKVILEKYQEYRHKKYNEDKLTSDQLNKLTPDSVEPENIFDSFTDMSLDQTQKESAQINPTGDDENFNGQDEV